MIGFKMPRYEGDDISFSDDPKYPDVEIELTGHDGNAGAIMGTVARALQRSGVSRDEIDQYRKQSMSGDYDNLLRTAMEWVTVY